MLFVSHLQREQAEVFNAAVWCAHTGRLERQQSINTDYNPDWNTIADFDKSSHNDFIVFPHIKNEFDLFLQPLQDEAGGIRRCMSLSSIGLIASHRSCAGMRLVGIQE